MSLRVAQSDKYEGSDRWRWAAWIDGTDAEMDTVQSVVWKLHKTFPQPVVRVSNRAEKFRIERVGWGTFTLAADVEQRDGRTLTLKHELQLEYPTESDAPPRGATGPAVKQVFLSFAAEDQRFAGIVRDELERAGIRVASSADVSSDAPWEVTARRMIGKSDAFVSVITTDTPSRFVEAEQEAATNAKLPVIVLVREGVRPELISNQSNFISFTPSGLRGTVQRVLARLTQQM